MKTRKFLSVILIVAMAMSLFTSAVWAESTPTEEVKYSTDGGTTWNEDSLLNAIYGCYMHDGSQIQLLKDITLTDDNWIDGQLLHINLLRLTVQGIK